MSRSGYHDDLDSQELNLWRGAVWRALSGKRGQAFLREMRDALDAMPVKRLITEELVTEAGECCAIGSVALARCQDVSEVNVEYPEEVAEAFGVAQAMVKEIAYLNDEAGPPDETPERRWKRLREWVEEQLLTPTPKGGDR